MKIVNWQSHFTSHQYYTWVELQKLIDEEIVHVVAGTTSDVRKDQGWTSLDMSGLNVINFSGKGCWRQGVSIIKQYPEYIHVFGGFLTNKKYFCLMLYAAFHGCKVMIMDEPYAVKSVGYFSDNNRWLNSIKVFLRPLIYFGISKIFSNIADKKKISILAISVLAEEQFSKAGFSKEQVFPFGYFVPKQIGISHDHIHKNILELVFVGALLERKGLDLLITAVENLYDEGVKVSLDVYGAGDYKAYISSNSTCVHYKGKIPFGYSQSIIAKYDALVLPSRHDGWGVVVNEALLQGVPVIVSDSVGAKCLIEYANNAGLIFQCDAVDDLIRNIREFYLNPELRSDMKKSAKVVANNILPENAAIYLRDVLTHYYMGGPVRPKHLWLG